MRSGVSVLPVWRWLPTTGWKWLRVSGCRWNGTPSNIAPVEHDDLGWFTAHDLPALRMSDPSALPDLIKALDEAR